MKKYYDIIKENCKDMGDNDWKSAIKDKCIYSDWDEPYELIRIKLSMTEEEFIKYLQTEDFNWDWEDFTNAEQQLLKDIKKSIYEVD